MTSHHPNVFARFPNHWAELRELLASNAAFADLCFDYETCLQHLNALSPCTVADFESTAAMYRETARELEQEIARAVESRPQRQPV